MEKWLGIGALPHIMASALGKIGNSTKKEK